MKKIIKKKIHISKLLVNPENPRFDPVIDEQEAINVMMNKIGKCILKIAEDIGNYGLNPSKNLIVTQITRDKFLTLEGNRRIIALKLLNNPSKANNKEFIDSFDKMKIKFGNKIPDEVECVVFPDKESAFHWINLEHTGKNEGIGILNWNSEQRQRFIDQHSEKNNSRIIQIFDFADKNKINRENVDPTTLTRIFSTPNVRKIVGIDFDKGLLKLVKNKKETIENLKIIFNEMSKNDFSVGSVYKKEDRLEWINKLLFLSDKQNKSISRENTKREIKKEKNPLNGDWITKELYDFYPKENRVKNMLKELKDIKPSQKTNICAVSLRVLLELLVYSFLDDNGEIKKMTEVKKDKIIKENIKRKECGEPEKLVKNDWSPEFKEMLRHIIREDIIKNPQIKKSIETYISKKSNENFLNELNQFIHNIEYDPDSESVENIWKQFGKKLFQIYFSSLENDKSKNEI